MIDNFKDRAVILGEYIKQTGATVRLTASVYGISRTQGDGSSVLTK